VSYQSENHWSKGPNRDAVLKRISESKTGKKLSPEMREKWSETAKKHGFGKWMKGKHLPLETRLKQSEANLGEKSSQWLGGCTPINQKIRHSIESRLWRESVFSRDNWVCQKCRIRGVRLNAHHIKHFSRYPELRFAIDNGVTLCVTCHKNIHKLKKIVSSTMVEHT